MADITLISIDGIPGSGKSTTALWLAEMMEKRGENVLLVPENEHPHRIRYLTELNQPLNPWSEISPEDFSMGCLNKFTTFLETVKREGFKGTIVLDGLLFHTDTTTLFLMDSVGDLFENHVQTMVKIGMTVRFYNICFWHQSPAHSLAKTCDQRAKKWASTQIRWKTSSPFCIKNSLHGKVGYLDFYTLYEPAIKTIIGKNFSTSAHLLEITDPGADWIASRKTIWNHLRQQQSPQSFSFDTPL